MLNISRIPDDEKGVTPVFSLHSVQNEQRTKAEKRPVFDDIEVVQIFLGANKYNAGVFPANEIWKIKQGQDANGFDISEPITYAMRFSAQYREFKMGGPQSISGTPLTELVSLSKGKVLELKALNIHTVEGLSILDGANLKMLGPNGREMKNDALAYLEKAANLAPLAAVQDELAKRDETIAKMQSQIDAMMGSATPVSREAEAPTEQTVTGFATFEDDDLKQWLITAGIEVDGRWGRNRLLLEAEKELAKTGKLKNAA